MTDANVGTATFAVRIAYDQPMDTNTNPVVTFSADVAGTLAYDSAQSWWTGDTTFLASFDVADADVVASSIGIGVTGARDATGLVQAAYNGTPAFGIDTLSAPPAPAAVVSATPSVATVTRSNLGTAGFSVKIVYDAAMNTNINPVVTFTPDVSGTLIFDPTWSWWTGTRTFAASFDVWDPPAVVPLITIGVTGAYDATGNVQAPYSSPNAFSIDTLNLPPGALPRAALADAVLSSGALNLTVGSVSVATDQHSAINPVDPHCSTAGRGWRCERTGLVPA